MQWTLELPYSKPPLSLNGRLHWAQQARIKAEVRGAAFWLAKSQRIPALDRPTVVLHYEPKGRARRDADNLVATLKPCVDGLVDAGVISDDTPDHVDTLMPVIDPHNGVAGRVYLVITS